MHLYEFALLAFSSLFVIVDPIATVPVFLAMTPADSPAQRVRMARLACWVMTGVLAGFALVGRWLFDFLGITMPAFQIAGSIVLLIVALDMLKAQRSRVQETQEEAIAGTEKEDVAITPLAVPLLAGPGAISTVLLMQARATDWPEHVVLFGCIGAVSLASYVILRVAARGTRWLSPIAMKITSRLMGLLLAAIACQFFVNALRDLKLIPAN